MSHKNYSKMSTASPEVKNDEIFVSGLVADTTETIDVVESVTTVATSIEEPGNIIDEIEESIEPSIIEGFVSGCGKLNVRKEPKAGSLVVCVIEKDAKVIINEDESTESFYKVYTEAGVEGYCVKDYLTITQ